MENKLYSKKIDSNNFQASNMKLEYSPKMIEDLKNFNMEKERGTTITNVEREQAIEKIAWNIFKRKLGVKFKRELTSEEKKKITDIPDYEYYREQAVKHYEKNKRHY
ncbi:MAG: hypothetical protein PF487_04555 [Bacteroidales bacterium]|jgi:mannosyltransferase OCH1-like enzyme|nr:hypothetical protein [Bacteroidales bacterium]